MCKQYEQLVRYRNSYIAYYTLNFPSSLNRNVHCIYISLIGIQESIYVCWFLWIRVPKMESSECCVKYLSGDFALGLGLRCTESNWMHFRGCSIAYLQIKWVFGHPYILTYMHFSSFKLIFSVWQHNYVHLVWIYMFISDKLGDAYFLGPNSTYLLSFFNSIFLKVRPSFFNCYIFFRIS